jgi:hypothetical protein
MLLQRLILAWAFRLFGLSIGVPAMGAFAYVGFACLTAPSVPEAQTQDGPAPGLIGLLIYGARGFAFAFRTLLGLVRSAFVIVTAGAFFLTVLGVLLFWVGVGIGKGAVWARLAAFAFSIAFAVFWTGLAGATSGWLRLLAGCGVGAALWALWVLTWKYR